MAPHFRKDSAKGITAPNPDAGRDVLQHITKHRGQKTPYTSVSEDLQAIKHFGGIIYKMDSTEVIDDAHHFISHNDLIDQLRSMIHASTRGDRVLATRALQLVSRAKEALIDWQFELSSVERKKRVAWCYLAIQKYFTKV